MSIEMLQMIIIYKIIYVTLFGKEIYEFKMTPYNRKKNVHNLQVGHNWCKESKEKT